MILLSHFTDVKLKLGGAGNDWPGSQGLEEGKLGFELGRRTPGPVLGRDLLSPPKPDTATYAQALASG